MELSVYHAGTVMNHYGAFVKQAQVAEVQGVRTLSLVACLMACPMDVNFIFVISPTNMILSNSCNVSGMKSYADAEIISSRLSTFHL